MEVSGKAGGDVRIDVEGSGFLRHMVRNLVGTLLEVVPRPVDVVGAVKRPDLCQGHALTFPSTCAQNRAAPRRGGPSVDFGDLRAQPAPVLKVDLRTVVRSAGQVMCLPGLARAVPIMIPCAFRVRPRTLWLRTM